jgi:hypothetical protein
MIVLHVPVLEGYLGHGISEKAHPPLLIVETMIQDKELKGTRVQEGEEVDQGCALTCLVVLRMFVQCQIDALIRHGHAVLVEEEALPRLGL